MRAKSLKSSQILRAHMPYFRRPSHIFYNLVGVDGHPIQIRGSVTVSGKIAEATFI